MEAETGVHGQIASLVEHVQVVQGELLSNWLFDFNGGLIFLAVRFVRSKSDMAMTGSTFY